MRSEQTKLFLDIDGVLLGKTDGSVTLAVGANDFLRFATSHFDCYWLTTHCQGNAETALNWMRPYVHEGLFRILKKIKPTRFNTLKTDALPKDGGFFWVEDRPLVSELKFLEKNGLVSCLIKVDSYTNNEDLAKCQFFLLGHLMEKKQHE